MSKLKKAAATPVFNPVLDLTLERVVDVPRELIWKAWTTPEYLKPWFCPKPWITPECEIDLRPGGKFYTVMRSPEGEEHKNVGCYLEIIENEKLVWTDALEPGFRPAALPQHGCLNNFMTAMIQLEPHKNGTKYTATALHRDEESRKKHEEMGFQEGWNICLDQLIAFVKTWK